MQEIRINTFFILLSFLFEMSVFIEFTGSMKQTMIVLPPPFLSFQPTGSF